MELLYVWIENYKNIYHQGFNFSPRCRFEFTPTDEKGDEIKYNLKVKGLNDDKIKVFGGTLTEKEESGLPENFFEDKITNVTAIVGQNGAGKSSLIEATLSFLEVLKEKISDNKFILIFRNKDNKLFYHSILNEEIFKDINAEKINETALPTAVLLSNVFDSNIINFKDKALNLSTNSLIRNTTGKMNPIGKYFQEEFVRQINFSIKFPDENLKLENFTIPKEITITIPNTSKWFVRDFKYAGYEDDAFKKIIEEFETYLPNLKDRKNFQEIIFRRILYIFYYYPFNATKIEDKKKDTKLLKHLFKSLNRKLQKKDFTILNFFNVTNLSKKFEKEKKTAKIERSKYFSNLKTFIEQSKKISDCVDTCIEKGDYITFLCKKIDENNILIFNNFIYSFMEAFDTPESQRLIEFNWEGMSSGQLAMLNIFSRFYSIKDQEDFKKKKKSIIILIDEGELYLHADWQKRFLNSVLKTLPIIFDDKQIQIILTSHTPFVLSDIPKENVIFLNKATPKTDDEKKDKYQIYKGIKYAEGKCIVVNGFQDKKQTFAANIHSLLSDSFFLEDGLMGEFAKGKIQGILRDLGDKSKSISEIRKDEIEKVIAMIGEPIIKRKLEQLFEKRFQEDIARMEEFYNNKLKELKSKREGNK